MISCVVFMRLADFHMLDFACCLDCRFAGSKWSVLLCKIVLFSAGM